MKAHRGLVLAFVGLAALTVLGGCVRVAPPPRLPFAMPDHFEGRRENAPSEDLSQWWLAFNDPQLTELIATALREAPDARTATDRLSAARAERSKALRAFDPQGGISAGAQTQNQQKTSGDVNLPNLPINVPAVQLGRTDSYSANFSVSWEVDLFGRRRAANAVASAEVQAAEWQVASAQAALAANVADALFRARANALDLSGTEAALADAEADLSAIDRKIRAGMASGIDRSPALLRRNSEKARLVALQGEVTALRREILVLIGQGVAPISSLVLAQMPYAPPPVPTSAPGLLLKRRPDVRIAEADILKALGGQAQARLALFPDFTLTPGIGLSGQQRSTLGYSTGLWSVGLQAIMPVLDRGRLMAARRASDARLQEAADSYEHAVQNAFGEADTVLTRLQADDARVAVLEQSEAEMRLTAGRMTKAVREGYAEPDSMRSTQRQWRAASDDLDAARLQRLRRTVQAYKALGGGWASLPQMAGKVAGKGAAPHG